MIPAKFDYTRPSSLGEAAAALADGGEDAKVIAGGQSLLPLLRLRFSYPSVLVDVGGLDELRGVRDARRRARDRRADHALRADQGPADRRPLRPAGAGGGDHRGPGGAAPGHDRRRAGARRPGRRPARGHHRAGRDARRHRAGGLAVGLARATSSSTTSPPRWPPGRSSPRSGCRSWTAGATATRSSTSPPRPGRSWGSPRSPGGPTGTWRRPGSGSPTWARSRSGPTRVEEAAAGAEASAAALAAAAARADEGTNPPSDLRAAADYRRHLARVLTGRALAAAAGVCSAVFALPAQQPQA